MESLKLANFLHPKPLPNGLDVQCKLQHFAIITYAADPAKFEGLFPDRFKLDTLVVDGKVKALISVVPFIDLDFTSAVFPFPKFTMGQTNYRIYIIDRESNERCVWFLGTTLDSWTLAVPKFVWNLPWYSGEVKFDCVFDNSQQIYLKYKMTTAATWAPATVELSQTKHAELSLPGFPDTETGLVYLTHPLASFYYRRDGKLGTYRVWHKRLDVSAANLKFASFELLSRLGLVSQEEQQVAHSVLIEPINEFTIYLPSKVVKSESPNFDI
ncbi:DUF2071 domain-containing protein [Aliiglaciecola sp. LCG003]|uniref:DUF2071 domain-containing protein n=1 Tax=Aliiglaciecola sp. LCG003 TaxID=3053655 RepID=UPI0025739FA9|nr:DUF2071 domain-containing protein [Aliiglaciecola sp. LCG003]WJG08902.1 DUF2071 domain-containing protein [Aliiglaciecola sp. LCG003]